MLPCLRKIGQFVYLQAFLNHLVCYNYCTCEASDEIPKMDVVTERLLHEERKRKGREDVEEN